MMQTTGIAHDITTESTVMTTFAHAKNDITLIRVFTSSAVDWSKLLSTESTVGWTSGDIATARIRLIITISSDASEFRKITGRIKW
jgi:hypothetical protein